MKKKAAVPSILVAVVLLVLGVTAEAQQAKKVPQIGYLGLLEIPERDKAFRQGLRELGYVEGKNISVEYRFAERRVERLADFAAELVKLKADVIIATGTQVTDALKRETKTIPIVFAVTVDPVESGFVASLARPGGNITGFSNLAVAGKRLELLSEVIPRISRVAVLQNPANSGSILLLKETEAVAKRLGIRFQSLEIRSADDLEGAFRAAIRERALVV